VCRNSEYGGGAAMVRAGGDRKHSEYGGEYGSAVEPRKRGEYGGAEERGKEYGGGGVERPSKWEQHRSPSANSAYRSDVFLRIF